jgi:hypothetical protein
MSTQIRASTSTPAPHEVVDLTADDSDDNSASSVSSTASLPPSPQRISRNRSRSARVAEWRTITHQSQRREAAEQDMRVQQAQDLDGPERAGSNRQGETMRQPLAPPFGGQEHPVLIESDDDESDRESEEFDIRSDLETTDSDSVASIASPEVQFLEERRIAQPPRQPADIAADLAQIARPPYLHLPDILRRSTQSFFNNMPNAMNELRAGVLDQLGGVRRRVPPLANGPMNVTMDYGRTGFAMGAGGFERSSETPQVVQEPYKAPPAAKEGFTRTFAEEDIILCPMCGDELAIGKSDSKQQVWVVKNCGHVCGPISFRFILSLGDL